MQFEGDIPASPSCTGAVWYSASWRRVPGAALGYFDVPPRSAGRPCETCGEPLRYSVIMEPTQQNWLYGLRYASSGPRGDASAGLRLFPCVSWRMNTCTGADLARGALEPSYRRGGEIELSLPE